RISPFRKTEMLNQVQHDKNGFLNVRRKFSDSNMEESKKIVWVIGIWLLGIIWNLSFGICDLRPTV
ncbi:MAG: hypothetical protein Q7V12_00600, partial [Deltaproteobacteria bacterium]|nr:hypothetical protein [Deltaproteobacteria bacterium]